MFIWGMIFAANLSMVPSGDDHSTIAETCAGKGYEPAVDARILPVPVVQCSYGENILAQRIFSMLELPDRAFAVDGVERAFSLPALARLNDDDRSAYFYVTLIGPNEIWKAAVSFSESFYPLDARNRPMFDGGTRPKLLNPKTRGEIRFDLTILSEVRKGPDEACALKQDAIASAFRRKGWKEETILQHPTHSVPTWIPTWRRGRSSATTEVDQRACVTGLTINLSPHPGRGDR